MAAEALPRLPGTAGVARARGTPWQRMGSFAFTELRVQGHEPLALATTSIVQTVFIVFVWLLDPSILPWAVVGAVIFSVFRIGEGVLNESAYIRIDHRLTDLYFASDLAPETYFLGMAAGMMTAFLPPVLVLGALALFVHPMSWAAFLLLVALLFGVWIFAASLGFVIGTVFEDSRAIWPYSTLVYNAFGVLPPVFYPLWEWKLYAPAVLQPIALLLPPSSAAALVANAEGLSGAALSQGEVLTAALSFAVEVAAVFLFAVYWSRRKATEP